jgi:hypothetical protein
MSDCQSVPSWWIRIVVILNKNKLETNTWYENSKQTYFAKLCFHLTGSVEEQ